MQNEWTPDRENPLFAPKKNCRCCDCACFGFKAAIGKDHYGRVAFRFSASAGGLMVSWLLFSGLERYVAAAGVEADTRLRKFANGAEALKAF